MPAAPGPETLCGEEVVGRASAGGCDEKFKSFRVRGRPWETFKNVRRSIRAVKRWLRLEIGLVRRLRRYFWGRRAADSDAVRPWWQRGRVWDSLTDGIRDETAKTNPG